MLVSILCLLMFFNFFSIFFIQIKMSNNRIIESLLSVVRILASGTQDTRHLRREPVFDRRNRRGGEPVFDRQNRRGEEPILDGQNRSDGENIFDRQNRRGEEPILNRQSEQPARRRNRWRRRARRAHLQSSQPRQPATVDADLIELMGPLPDLPQPILNVTEQPGVSVKDPQDGPAPAVDSCDAVRDLDDLLKASSPIPMDTIS